jgi:hypothetical protein
MSEWKFRFAEKKDADAFSNWAAHNPQIDPKDLTAALSSKNPTVAYFAVENPKGEVVLFAPFHFQLTLSFLGFNPKAEQKEKLKAMAVLTDGATAFAVQYGIREITTLSKEEYPVAQWGLKHGFRLEDRQTLTLDINKILDEAKLCAPAAAK